MDHAEVEESFLTVAEVAEVLKLNQLTQDYLNQAKERLKAKLAANKGTYIEPMPVLYNTKSSEAAKVGE